MPDDGLGEKKVYRIEDFKMVGVVAVKKFWAYRDFHAFLRVPRSRSMTLPMECSSVVTPTLSTTPTTRVTSSTFGRERKAHR